MKNKTKIKIDWKTKRGHHIDNRKSKLGIFIDSELHINSNLNECFYFITDYDLHVDKNKNN